MKTVSGRIVRTTEARSVIASRRVVIVTQSPSAMPSCSASRGWISTFGSGCMSTSGPMRRVCVPERYWLTTRPVVR